MRPARMPSTWVKILPWYYTERNQPTRAVTNTAAINFDLTSLEDVMAELGITEDDLADA